MVHVNDMETNRYCSHISIQFINSETIIMRNKFVLIDIAEDIVAFVFANITSSAKMVIF